MDHQIWKPPPLNGWLHDTHNFHTPHLTQSCPWFTQGRQPVKHLPVLDSVQLRDQVRGLGLLRGEEEALWVRPGEDDGARGKGSAVAGVDGNQKCGWESEVMNHKGLEGGASSLREEQEPIQSWLSSCRCIMTLITMILRILSP